VEDKLKKTLAQMLENNLASSARSDRVYVPSEFPWEIRIRISPDDTVLIMENGAIAGGESKEYAIDFSIIDSFSLKIIKNTVTLKMKYNKKETSIIFIFKDVSESLNVINSIREMCGTTRKLFDITRTITNTLSRKEIDSIIEKLESIIKNEEV